MALWGRTKKRIISAHYRTHKELARTLIMARLSRWNEYYGFTYNRVSIRDTQRRWGSCSSKGNLNFSYKLIFLPETLMDYVIVHELCHLAHMNHAPVFWTEVSRALPDYRERKMHLRRITNVPARGFPTSAFQSDTIRK